MTVLVLQTTIQISLTSQSNISFGLLQPKLLQKEFLLATETNSTTAFIVHPVRVYTFISQKMVTYSGTDSVNWPCVPLKKHYYDYRQIFLPYASESMSVEEQNVFILIILRGEIQIACKIMSLSK